MLQVLRGFGEISTRRVKSTKTSYGGEADANYEFYRTPRINSNGRRADCTFPGSTSVGSTEVRVREVRETLAWQHCDSQHARTHVRTPPPPPQPTVPGFTLSIGVSGLQIDLSADLSVSA